MKIREKLTMNAHRNAIAKSSLNKLRAVHSQPERHLSNACICKDDLSGEAIRRQPS